MKKFISILLIATTLMFSVGCANSKVINGKEYKPYGLFNENVEKADSIQYKTSVGNVIWSCLLVETVVAPVLLIGLYLYEPVSIK